MITQFLITQHEKQIKILKRIDDLNLRISSHKDYLKNMNGRWAPATIRHYQNRVDTDETIKVRLLGYYTTVMERIVEKVLNYKSEVVSINQFEPAA